MYSEYVIQKVAEQANEIMDSEDKRMWYMAMDNHADIQQFYEDVTCKVTDLLDEKGYTIDVSSQMGIGCVALFKNEKLVYKTDLENETEEFFNLAANVEGDDWLESVMSVAQLLVQWHMNSIEANQ